MARTSMALSVVVAIAVAATTMLAHQASAQSGCTTAIVSLAPCLGYITGNSSAPSSTCCAQLGSVVQSQAQCLCQVLNGGGSSFGININQTQAMALPAACKIQTPNPNLCKAGAGGPATSPTAAPTTPTSPATPTTPSAPGSSTPTSPATPSVPSVPAGNGSKTTPSAGGGDASGSADTSSYRSGGLTIITALFVAASLSVF